MSEDIESQTENKNKPHEIGINEGIWIMTSGIIMSTIFTTLWTIQILEDRDKLNNSTGTYIYRPHRTALTLGISGGVLLLLILPFIGCIKVILINYFHQKKHSIIQGSKNSCIGGCYVICNLCKICN